jgi:hypothetical protein
MIRKCFLCSAAFLLPASMAMAATSIVPKTDPGYGMSITGYYLMPGANNLEYAVYTQPLPVTVPSWKGESVKPGFHPAFDLATQYTFKGGVDQLKFDWFDIRTESSASASARGSASIAPPYFFGPFAQQLRGSSARSKVNFTLDSVNTTYDHLIYLGRHIQLAPFVGIGTAYLKQHIKSNFTGLDGGSDPYSITSYNTSRFIGIGPRFGIDATGYVTQHFSLLANIAATLLVGSMYSNTHFLSYGDGNTTAKPSSLADKSQMSIVPELDSNLGLAYDVTFKGGSTLNFEIGYMFKVYLDGINQVVPATLVPNTFDQGVIAIGTEAEVQSNFDLQGPYLKVSWKF